MALPCVLLSSSVNDYKPNQFVKSILNVDELPPPKDISKDVEGYEWMFENKYYKTTIHLCTTSTRTIGDEQFSASVEAFIHYFDPNEVASFELTKAWIPYLKHIEPEIKMLVCGCSRENDVVNRKQTLEWCIQNGFELVELKPDQDEEEEDDFPETNGIDRIIQAFNAHTWPNLEMKDSPPVQSPLLRQMMKEQHYINEQNKLSVNESSSSSNEQNPSCHDQISASEASKSQTVTLENNGVQIACNNSRDVENVNCVDEGGDMSAASGAKGGNNEEAQFDDIDWKALLADDSQKDIPLTDGDLGVEEFEQLFTKLKVMKDKAEKLPEEERRKYAENIAVSFWKAIGGDEDEILGLDDSDAD